MGSSSSGKFHEYPPSKGKPTKKDASSGRSGGSEHDDQCVRDLEDVLLEEVGRSVYLQSHKTLPKVGVAVHIRNEKVGPRLSIDTEAGESVGFLPVQYNYLVICMKKGFDYLGELTYSSQKPVPSLRVNLRASQS